MEKNTVKFKLQSCGVFNVVFVQFQVFDVI